MFIKNCIFVSIKRKINTMKKIIFLLSITIVLFSCTTTHKEKEIQAPKYIFYFIGDGYGPAQAHLAEAYLAQKKGHIKPDTLFMNTVSS